MRSLFPWRFPQTSDFAPMVSLTNNRSQEQHKSFSIPRLTGHRAVASIRSGFHPMSQDKTHSFDAIVVGSGASGGWACKRLAEAALKVALLDAGRPQSDKNFTAH